MFKANKILKAKKAWSIFTKNHPKFPGFMNAVYNDAIEEGTIIEINVTKESGQTLTTNLKLTESDIKMFRELKER